MKTYIVRAAKYAVYLIVLLLIVLAVMNVVTKSESSMMEMLFSVRGLYLLAVVVVFAAIYPMMGYVKRTLTFDATQKTDELVNVMSLCGYTRTDDGRDNTKMEFRASGKMKRLSMMYEDQITIVTVDGLSVIAGPRKEVVRAAFRFDTFIN